MESSSRAQPGGGLNRVGTAARAQASPLGCSGAQGQTVRRDQHTHLQHLLPGHERGLPMVQTGRARTEVHRLQRLLRHHSRLRDSPRGGRPREVQARRGEDRRAQQEGQHGHGALRGPGEAERLREDRLRDRTRRGRVPEAAAFAAEHRPQARNRRRLDPHRLHLQGQERLLRARRGPVLHEPAARGQHIGPQRHRARPLHLPGSSRALPTSSLTPNDTPPAYGQC